MSFRLVALLTLTLGLAPLGCGRNKPVIPTYPSSDQYSMTPNVETDAGILYLLRRESPDGLSEVAEFYRKELVGKRGWTESRGLGPMFTDGNLHVTFNGNGSGTAEPIDPTRRGGQVVVYEGQNRTLIATWEYVPAK